MADKLTVARPYARAAFEEARAQGKLDAWSGALHTAAAVVQDPRTHALLGNPHVTPSELAQFIDGIAGDGVGETGGNFLRTLADNRRLPYLPEIAAQFDAFKDADQGVADVTVTSAVPLDAAQQGRLTAALEQRLKRKIRLHCAVDPELIGGAVLRSGDLVIDGSLSTRLARIAYELTA